MTLMHNYKDCPLPGCFCNLVGQLMNKLHNSPGLESFGNITPGSCFSADSAYYSIYSGISGISTYSGMSLNSSPHGMPHFKESSVLYQDSDGLPGGNSNGSQLTSDASAPSHSDSVAEGHQHQPHIPNATHSVIQKHSRDPETSPLSCVGSPTSPHVAVGSVCPTPTSDTSGHHHKKKGSRLGRILRRTFSRNPRIKNRKQTPSPTQLDPLLCQGTETDDIVTVNGNHSLDHNQIYNTSQNSGISGVSSYSGMSGVSQNNGPHRMPNFKEPSVIYQESGGVHFSLPPGSGGGVHFTDHPSQRTSDTSIPSNPGSVHSSHSHQYHPYNPSAIHSSHNIIHHQYQHQHQHQNAGGPETSSLPGLQYPTPSHVAINLVGEQSSLPQLAASQTVFMDRTYSDHSNHSNKSSGRLTMQGQYVQHQSPPHLQAHPYGQPPLQSHFITKNDLMNVKLALLHNKHCQIPSCCCHKVRELIESQDFRPNYSSGSNRRRRPPNLSLMSEEHNRNPNLHPHYHLTTKSHLRRVSKLATTDHRRARAKSLTDLTPLTEVPETPTKTPAVGGSIVPTTPVYVPRKGITEQTTEDDTKLHLLREISISADNIPALCWNDCPLTPSPVEESRHLLAKDPSKARKRRSLRSTKPKLKCIRETTSSIESDDSRTSSPDKSSQSDDDGIDMCIHPQKQKSVPHQKQETLINDTLRSPPGTKSSQHDGATNAEMRKNAMSNPHMRRSRSVSPLSVCSQVSGHSRRSAAPYETEVVRKQNGIVSETTEC